MREDDLMHASLLRGYGQEALLLVVAFLAIGVLACDGGGEQALVEAEHLRAEARVLEERALAEAALREAEARAREAAEAEARAAKEALAVSERLLAEREQKLAEREAQAQRQQALLEEKKRLAKQEADLAEREQALLEMERELEAREVDLALAEDEMRDRMEVSNEEADLPEGRDSSIPQAPQAETPRRQSSGERASLQPGKVFEVEIMETLSSRTNRVGDTFAAKLAHDLRAEDGTLVIPEGAEVVGEITEVTPLRRVGGQASLGIEFTRIIAPSGEAVEIRAGFLEMGADKRGDKKKIIGATVAGAILGRVLGGKGGDNVAVGAAVGAAAGTAAAARAKGKDAEIPAGEMVALQLEEIVTVEVEMTGTVQP